MKEFLFSVLVLLQVSVSNAQTKVPYVNAVYDFSYTIIGKGGQNGLSVCYNSRKDIYYCVFAGNSNFPLETFSRSGRNLHTTECGQDMRGLWYNPASDQLEGTIYNNGGLFRIDLINGEMPGFPNIIHFSFPLPDAQSVTTYDPATKEIYTMYNEYFVAYNSKTLKRKKNIEPVTPSLNWAHINLSSVIVTGYKNYEFGIYDFYEKKVYFLNRKGKQTHVMYMPPGAPDPDVFCFAFCNDRIWLYEPDERTWYAYRAFYNQ